MSIFNKNRILSDNINILILHPELKVHKQFQNKSNIKLIFDSREFNTIVNKLKHQYSAYIDSLSSNYGKNIDWWVSSVASRNILQSSSFLNICYLSYVNMILEKNTCIDQIICKSHGLKKSIKKLSVLKRNPHIRLIIFNEGIFKDKIKNNFFINVINVINVFNFIYDSVKKKYFAWDTKKFDKVNVSLKMFLVDVFVLNNSFHDHIFWDRYYGKFSKYAATLNWIYLPTFYGLKITRNIFLDLRKSEVPFLIKEDYLRISDYFWVILHFARLLKLPKFYFYFDQFSVYYIFQEDLVKNLTTSSFESLLNYRVIKRLSEKKILLSLCLDWFENQNIDKALNLAIHKYYPKVKTIGYQAFIVSSNYLCLQATKLEQENKVLPDFIATSGKGNITYLKELNENLNVITSPAFRFQHLWQMENSEIKDEKMIQVSLPIMLSDSLEILDMLNHVINQLNPEFKFAIKIHPLAGRKKIDEFLFTKNMNYITIWEGPFSEYLTKTKLLISSTSSVIVETLSMGIPVIVIGSKSQITHNPIPTTINKNIWSLCYTVDELKAKIEHYANLNNSTKMDFNKIALNIRKEYFEPVSEQSIGDFLSIINEMAI